MTEYLLLQLLDHSEALYAASARTGKGFVRLFLVYGNIIARLKALLQFGEQNPPSRREVLCLASICLRAFLSNTKLHGSRIDIEVTVGAMLIQLMSALKWLYQPEPRRLFFAAWA